MLILFVIMISFVIAEEIYIRKISIEMCNCINTENILSETNFNSLESEWEKNKEILTFFISESELETISTNIRLAKYNLQTQNNMHFRQNIITVLEMIRNLPDL